MVLKNLFITLVVECWRIVLIEPVAFYCRSNMSVSIDIEGDRQLWKDRLPSLRIGRRKYGRAASGKKFIKKRDS